VFPAVGVRRAPTIERALRFEIFAFFVG